MRGVRQRLRITWNNRTTDSCRPINSRTARAVSTTQRGDEGKPAASHNISAATDNAQTNPMRRRSTGAIRHSSSEPQNSTSKVQPNSGYTAETVYTRID